MLTLTVGCGLRESVTGPDEVPASSEKERYIVSEVSRFATIAEVKVKGELTEYLYTVDISLCPNKVPCHAFGWYVGGYGKGSKGTAYFYRPDVEGQAKIDLSWNAAHEVCHAVTGAAHDAAHHACNVNLYGGSQPAGAIVRCSI